jgi:hypothetical protein
MTKKLHPTRSLRSLLFGGPHSEELLQLPMEETINRLRLMEQSGRLGEYPCGPIDFNDLGRVVKWSFTTQAPVANRNPMQVPVKGSFALQGDQRIQVKMRVGSDLRPVVLWSVFGVLSLVAAIMAGFIASVRPRWELPELVLILVVGAIILSLIVLSVIELAPRIPRMSIFSGDDIEYIVYALRQVIAYGRQDQDSHE